MKLFKYVLLYGLIYLCLCFVFQIKQRELRTYADNKQRFQMAYDSAVDDALDVLVDTMDGSSGVDREKAVEVLVRSLASSLGIENETEAAERLQLYIPVVMVAEEDGASFYYHDIRDDAGGKTLFHLWSEKIPYWYEENGTVFALRLDGTLCFLNGQDYFLMEYDQFREEFRDYELADPQKYEAILYQTINRTYQENLRYYVNRHNHIAEQFGVSYDFYLPYLEDANSRLINDVGMAVFFEGFPLSTNRTFDQYTFAGSDMIKGEGYYYGKVKEVLYYHKKRCPYADMEGEVAWSKWEAAGAGAYPCPVCAP